MKVIVLMHRSPCRNWHVAGVFLTHEAAGKEAEALARTRYDKFREEEWEVQ